MELSRKKPKKKITYIIVLSIIGSICLSILGILGYKTYITYSALDKMTKGEKIVSTIRPQKEKVDIKQDPVSILFLGLEDYATKGVNGRTDSMILVTYNPNDQTLKTLSIPRDSYVDIVDFDVTSKINGAYARGGIRTTIKTVEKFLNVPIDYYVTVNFSGFKNIVDAVGGIDVNVPFDFWENTDTQPRRKVYFHKGLQHLDGLHALAYSRMRKRDFSNGDFGRQERQRQVLSAIIKELKTPMSILKIDTYAKEFSKNITTNIGMGDAFTLFKSLPNDIASHTESLAYTGEGGKIKGIWYYVPDKTSVQDVSKKMREHLGLTDNSLVKRN